MFLRLMSPCDPSLLNNLPFYDIMMMMKKMQCEVENYTTHEVEDCMSCEYEITAVTVSGLYDAGNYTDIQIWNHGITENICDFN